MTDQKTIDEVTARLLGSIVICCRQDLREVHVNIGEEVTVFNANFSGTWERAIQLARAFATTRQRGTKRQIIERFVER